MRKDRATQELMIERAGAVNDAATGSLLRQHHMTRYLFRPDLWHAPHGNKARNARLIVVGLGFRRRPFGGKIYFPQTTLVSDDPN